MPSPPPEAEDLLLLADVLYDPANRPLVDGLQATGRELLIADARVGGKAYPHGNAYGREAATLPDLDESPLFRTVRFYCPASPAGDGTKVPPKAQQRPLPGPKPCARMQPFDLMLREENRGRHSALWQPPLPFFRKGGVPPSQ